MGIMLGERRLPRKDTSMSKVRQCGTAILVMIASLVFATAALAQMPQSPWKKAAPFPETDEELYGVAVNSKLYVIGGWGEGKARGANYGSNPAPANWRRKKRMRGRATNPAWAAPNARIKGRVGSFARKKPKTPSAAPGNRM